MAASGISAHAQLNLSLFRVSLAFGSRELPRLYEELQDPDLTTRQRALTALCDLLHDPDRVYKALKLGFVVKLRDLLHDNDGIVRTKATEAIFLLSSHSVGREVLLNEHMVTSLSDLLDESVDSCRKNMHQTLDMLVQCPGGAACVSSLVPRLLEKLDVEQEDIQVLILATLSSCVRFDAQPALLSNAVHTLSGLLTHTSTAVRCSAARVLLDISVPGGGKMKVCEENVLPVLVDLLKDNDMGIRANAAGVIMNTAIITTGKFEALKAQAIPALLELVTSEDTTVCTNVLRALSQLAEAPAGRQQLLEHVTLLETRLTHSSPMVTRAAATAIRVICWKP